MSSGIFCRRAVGLLVGGLATAANAKPYSFYNIAELADSELGTFSPPMLNDARQFVYAARVNGDGTVYTGTPGSPVRARFSRPAGGILSTSGFAQNGAFAGVVDVNGAPGVYSAPFSDGPMNILGDMTNNQWGVLSGNVLVNSSGTVAFWEGEIIENRLHSFITIGGNVPLTHLVDVGGAVGASMDLIDDGTVVYQGSTADYRPAYYATCLGGPTTLVADNSGPWTLQQGGPDVNNSGQMVFVADLDAGGRGIILSTLDRSRPDQILVDGTGPLDLFYSLSLNDRGEFAYLAIPDAGGIGIYTGADIAADRVIATGDTLFGSVVTFVRMSKGGLNNHGDLAFWYELENGKTGMAIAFAPEPASIGLISCGMLFATRRRRAAA